jgi:hypothetical protein
VLLRSENLESSANNMVAHLRWNMKNTAPTRVIPPATDLRTPFPDLEASPSGLLRVALS